MNSAASSPYATANQPRPTIAPASSGPAAEAIVLAVKFSVLAAATSDAGSTRGTTAPRVDEATANAPDWTATSTSSSARLRSPASACRSSPSVQPHSTSDDPMSSTRRSAASAIAPPHNPNTTSGRKPTAPSRPTQNEEPVMS